MEISYRRTVQVREYESITIEAKTTDCGFSEAIDLLEKAVDKEITEHRDRLRKQYIIEESADEVDLS